MDIKTNGNQMTITISLDPKGRPSSTGKSTVLFSSGGFTQVPSADMRVNLTVIARQKSK